MRRKSLTAALCISLALWLSIGCNFLANVAPAGPPAASTPVTGAGEKATPPAGPPSAAPQKETEPAKARLYPFQGKVSFEIDGANSASLSVDAAASKDQAISLATSSGIQWTLTIPPGALEENVEIKISELKNIVSEDLGSLTTGLLLEPDHLRFARMVTLRMEGASLGEHPIILSGAHNGARLDFALAKKDAGGITAYLTHFSTAYGDPLTDEEKRKIVEEAAKEGYTSVMKRALQVLDENPPKILTPPAVPLRCLSMEGKQYKKDVEVIKAYQEQFREPEYSLISALMTIALQDEAWDPNEPVAEVVQRLLQRTLSKVDLLWQTYYPQEEYFLPVSAAANDSEQDVSNLEFIVFGRTEPRLVYFQKRQEWASLLAQKFLKALRDEHDYEVLSALLLTDKLAMLDATMQYKNILPEITKALTFKMQYVLQASTDVEYDTVTWETSGTAQYNLLTTPNGAPGEGLYSGFNWPVPEGLPPVQMTSPKDFAFEVLINKFDACESKTLEVSVNRFAADMETYLIGGMEMPYANGNGFVSAITLAAFEKEMAPAPGGRKGDPWFKFTLPVQNRKAIAAEFEFPRQVPNNTANLKIQVIHTPEK